MMCARDDGKDLFREKHVTKREGVMEAMEQTR